MAIDGGGNMSEVIDEFELVVEPVDLKDPVAMRQKALELIDAELGVLGERQMVSASEVTDLLLDLRSLLS